MQAGFALVETGFCRAKHAAHVMSTNFAIFGLGFVAFFLVGYPLDVRRLQLRAVRTGTSRSAHALVGSGNWVFLWQGGWALSSIGRLRRRHRSRRSSSTWSRSWTRRRRSRPARWPSGGSGRRSSAGACSAVRIYYPLFGGVDVGRRLAGQARQHRRSSASATSTSPAPASCTRWVVSRRSPVRSSSVPRIGKYGKDGKPRALPGAQHPDGACSARSSCCSAGSASTPRRRFAATDIRFAVVADEHRDRRRVRCDRCDVLRHEASREARPGHDGQRHARRSRGDHGAVRLRPPVGGGGHRHHRRRSSSSRPCVFIEKQGHRRPGGRDLGPRRRAASSACCPSASSPTASTAPAGTARRRVRRPRPAVSPGSSTTATSACVSSARRRSVRS